MAVWPYFLYGSSNCIRYEYLFFKPFNIILKQNDIFQHYIYINIKLKKNEGYHFFEFKVSSNREFRSFHHIIRKT